MVNTVNHIAAPSNIEKALNADSQILGNKVRDLITKFFYKDSHLCFQILLQVDGGETVFFREFMDYAEYKKVFSELQQARLQNIVIDIPRKIMFTNNNASIVA